MAADPDQTLFSACDVMVPSWESKEDGDLHETVAVEVFRANRHLILEKPSMSASNVDAPDGLK